MGDPIGARPPSIPDRRDGGRGWCLTARGFFRFGAQKPLREEKAPLRPNHYPGANHRKLAAFAGIGTPKMDF